MLHMLKKARSLLWPASSLRITYSLQEKKRFAISSASGNGSMLSTPTPASLSGEKAYMALSPEWA